MSELLHEGVRARLLDETGGAALEERVEVRLRRLLARLDLGVDDRLADPDRVAEHRAVGRQGQRVDHLRCPALAWCASADRGSP